jgi:hypothetical protein
VRERVPHPVLHRCSVIRDAPPGLLVSRRRSQVAIFTLVSSKGSVNGVFRDLGVPEKMTPGGFVKFTVWAPGEVASGTQIAKVSDR